MKRPSFSDELFSYIKREEAMQELTEGHFTFRSIDQTAIYGYKWWRKDQEIKGIVQISHGMAETASRYKRFADSLTANGFIVYANDHRGHGKTAQNIESLGYLGETDGFKLLIADIAQLTEIIRAQHPNLPIYLFSHSMGSFAAQRYIIDYEIKIDGLILSGSNGEQGFLLQLGKGLAGLEMFFRGKTTPSKLMDTLIFGLYNKKFHPKETGFEWLTRDKEELAKYIENPYCGTIFPASFYYEFLDTLEYVEDERNFHKIPEELPILILAGGQDPVGDFGKGPKRLNARYRKEGVQDLAMKLYEGAQHELLNELNRDEVTGDILTWIQKRVANQKE